MADENYSNDKRLRQDDIEQKKKENASTGMVIAFVIILLGVLVGFYLYNREAVVNTNERIITEPASSNVQKNNNTPTNNTTESNGPTTNTPETNPPANTTPETTPNANPNTNPATP